MSEIINKSTTSNSLTNHNQFDEAISISKSNIKTILPWDKFSQWVSAILVVTFDIEMGQSLESIYPSMKHVKLTPNEKLNICYMSFPDSNSGFLGDTQYHFRYCTNSHLLANINQSKNKAGDIFFANDLNLRRNNMSNPVHDQYNRKTFTGFEVEPNFMYGYVFFRQVKDKSLKRGYFQKSVVLLSKFPFVSLFSYILNLIAIEYFTTGGGEVLETACHDIDNWPLPMPGELLSLPILGHLIEVSLPIKIDKYILPIVYKKDNPNLPIALPPVHELNLYKCLQPVLIHIHLIWELILLNEPIVVIAHVPNVCSELVQALTSIIWPLKYSSDFRPYFTIHNSEFAQYSAKNMTPPGIIIGVTNPFFTKCLQHWPNIIKIASHTTGGALGESALFSNGASNSNGDESPATLQTQTSTSSGQSKPVKIKKTNNIRVVDSKPAVYTHHECFLNKDKEILKSLVKGAESNRPTEAQSAILRRHLMELTQSFMIPLERYFTSLMPLHKSISPFKSVPRLKEFNVNEFIRTLKNTGGPAAAQLLTSSALPSPMNTLKGDLVGLYKRFFNTLNFKCWLEQKQNEAETKLEQLQLELLCDYDVNKWLIGKQEIEIIDQYMNLKKKLDSLAQISISDSIENSNKTNNNDQIKQKIKSIISIFLNALPEDVRSILK